jgi:hypothetical protein
MSDDAEPAEPQVPRWLRVVYVMWFVPWFTVYWGYFGWQFVLWFCCLANVYVLMGCLTQRALWFSLAAMAALGVQLIYTLDFLVLCATRISPTGVTAYMLDASRPLGLRALSLFHVWMPALLLHVIGRVGYDRRALFLQSLVAACLLPLCYLAFDPGVDTNDPEMPRVLGIPFDRDFNLNWVHAFYDRPEPGVGASRFWAVLLGYPLLVHLPTHLLLSWWGGARAKQ